MFQTNPYKGTSLRRMRSHAHFCISEHTSHGMMFPRFKLRMHTCGSLRNMMLLQTQNPGRTPAGHQTGIGKSMQIPYNSHDFPPKLHGADSSRLDPSFVLPFSHHALALKVSEPAMGQVVMDPLLRGTQSHSW